MSKQEDFDFTEDPLFVQRPPEQGELQPSYAENALVGSLLMNSKNIEVAAGIVQPRHFGDPVLGAIYRRILAEDAAGRGVDAFLIVQWFRQAAVTWDTSWTDQAAVAFVTKLVGAGVGPVLVRGYGLAVKEQWARRFLGQSLETAYEQVSDNGEPLDDVLAKVSRDVSTTSAETNASGAVGMHDAVSRVLQASANVAAGQKKPYLSTQMPEIDKLLGGGLLPETLMILAGRPGHGKSALAVQIGVEQALMGVPVNMWSGEMSVEQVAGRAVSYLARVPFWRIRDGICSEAETSRLSTAYNRMRQLPFEIDDTGGLTITQILSRADAVIRRRGSLGVQIIDHMHHVRHDAKTAKLGLPFAIGQITFESKMWAKKTGVPVLCLAQLNRGPETREDKAPVVGDLRGSGDIEQDADYITFVYRPEQYLSKMVPVQRAGEKDANFDERKRGWQDQVDRWKGRVQVYTGKNRHAEIAATEMGFNGETTSFIGAWDQQ